MKSQYAVFFILALTIFCPVIDLSGHFINLAEFYVYFLFIMGLKKSLPVYSLKVLSVYFVAFFVVCVFTSIIAFKPINNYDVFILRNCAQLICLLSVLYSRFITIQKECDNESFHNFILQVFYLLSLPAVVVLLQRFDILHMRELVLWLYKPQFFFLDKQVFSEFRYTSIFKDFFTAGVYFIALTTGMFYFALNARLAKLQRMKVYILIFIIYLCQLFVSRTSLLIIPLNVVLILLFASSQNFLSSLKRLFFLLIIVVPLFLALLSVFTKANFIKGDWALEALGLFSGNRNALASSSSYLVMQEWNEKFFGYVLENPSILFIPNHDYDLKEASSTGLYTDSFYAQEIYRYGIYGVLSYLYLVIFLLKKYFKKNKGLFIIVFSFVLLNYKGGNVFFMPKNIYLYAFIFSAFLVWDNRQQEQK